MELELICWELPFHGRRGSFCSWKRPHIGPIRPKDQPSYLSLAVLLGEWWVGGENLFMWSKSEWPSLETRQSWVLKLSKSYKTNLMTPMLFWGTFLKPLWLCLCWVMPIFLCCVWVNSLNSLHELNTLLNPPAHDCYLNTTNLGAHHFHLSCDAFDDLCLRNFPLAAHVPLLALWRCRMILSGFFLLSLQFRKGWKIPCQKSLKDFFVCLRELSFQSLPLPCIVF